jgi:hypothetical protein
MADRATEYVREEFSLATVVARHAELYRELIGRPSPERTPKREAHVGERG